MGIFRRQKNISNQPQSSTGGGAIVQANLDAHLQNTNNPHSVTKAQLSLGNVDNTSDANKPVSTAQATALATKQATIVAGTTAQYYRGDKSFQTLDKTAVGLANVDNTADTAKPVSTAQQAEINLAVGATVGNATRVPFYSAIINRLTSSNLFTFDGIKLVISNALGAVTDLLVLYNTGGARVNVGQSATAYFSFSYQAAVAYLQTFANLTPIEIQGSHVRIASKLRIGSAVAPVETLDVTGTMAVSGVTTHNGATVNNGVAIFNASERHKCLIYDLDITLGTTHYALYMYNAVARTVTLPDPTTVPGVVYVISRTGVGTVTIATLGTSQLVQNLNATFAATTTLNAVGTYGSNTMLVAMATGHWRRIMNG